MYGQTRKLPIPTLDVHKQTNLIKEDKLTPIREFLNANFEIKVNCFDHTKSVIKSKKKIYPFPIKFNDISLELFQAGLTTSDNVLRKILSSPNQIKTYNPIIDYLESLKDTYNGFSHIDKLCTFFKARDFNDKDKNHYQERLNYYVKKWIVATAATSLNMYANPVALGFIHSEEGVGKTYFFDFIVPNELKDFYTIYDPKKMIMNESFARHMVVLFDELVGINNRSSNTFKNVIQLQNINLKNSYDPFPVNYPRIGSAGFTTNRTPELGGFITQNLGYRRFGSIEIEDIDQSYSKEIDVDQIWAEAFVLINSGFKYQFDMTDFKELKEYNKRYVIKTPAMMIIELNYRKPEKGEKGELLQPSEILQNLYRSRKIKSEHQEKITAETIGVALMHLKFERKMLRLDKGPKYYYHVIHT